MQYSKHVSAKTITFKLACWTTRQVLHVLASLLRMKVLGHQDAWRHWWCRWTLFCLATPVGTLTALDDTMSRGKSCLHMKKYHVFIHFSRALYHALLHHGKHCKKLNMDFKTPHTLLEVLNVLDHEYIETRKTSNIYDRQLAKLNTHY